MKLGIIKYWDEASFIYASEKKLDFLEFCINDDQAAEEFPAQQTNINKWIKQYGVQAGSVGRWSGMRINPDGTVNEKAKQSDLTLISTAAKINCPVYNCGVNYTQSKSYDENIEIAASYLNDLVSHGKKENVKVAVYNCEWDNFVVKAQVWKKILPLVENLGIKYDCSHAIYRNDDYFAELRDYGKYIYHFHIKGNVKIGETVFDDAPAGLDMIPWGAVMDVLYANRYKGGVSIEPHSKYWNGQRGEWAIDFTIKHMRNILMPDGLDD